MNGAPQATGAGDAVVEPDADDQVLRLYVAGQTARSVQAVANIRRLCADSLRGLYRLEVIDLYQQPHLAQDAQILAVPALIKRLPAPPRMVIGDMSDAQRVLTGLDLLAAWHCDALPQTAPNHPTTPGGAP